MPKIKGDVEFKDVSFEYDENSKVLSKVNFKVKKGETIGIIGGTGCGKSTLVNLIPRFYDVTSGEILINGVNVNITISLEVNIVRTEISIYSTINSIN